MDGVPKHPLPWREDNNHPCNVSWVETSSAELETNQKVIIETHVLYQPRGKVKRDFCKSQQKWRDVKVLEALSKRFYLLELGDPGNWVGGPWKLGWAYKTVPTVPTHWRGYVMTKCVFTCQILKPTKNKMGPIPSSNGGLDRAPANART